MTYRILITLAVIAVLAFAAVKGSDTSPDEAPAPSSSPDEAKFKGLTIPN